MSRWRTTSRKRWGTTSISARLPAPPSKTGRVDVAFALGSGCKGSSGFVLANYARDLPPDELARLGLTKNTVHTVSQVGLVSGVASVVVWNPPRRADEPPGPWYFELPDLCVEYPSFELADRVADARAMFTDPERHVNWDEFMRSPWNVVKNGSYGLTTMKALIAEKFGVHSEWRCPGAHPITVRCLVDNHELSTNAFTFVYACWFLALTNPDLAALGLEPTLYKGSPEAHATAARDAAAGDDDVVKVTMLATLRDAGAADGLAAGEHATLATILGDVMTNRFVTRTAPQDGSPSSDQLLAAAPTLKRLRDLVRAANAARARANAGEVRDAWIGHARAAGKEVPPSLVR